MSRMATVIRPVGAAASFIIASGQQNSNVLLESQLMGMSSFSLQGLLTPDSATHIYVIQISNDGGTTWANLNDGTSNVVAPATGVAYVYPNPPVTAYRIRDITGVTTGITSWDMGIEVPIYGIH
jgi:hypothetical protein